MDERRIQKMTHLAMFEETDGREDIKISKYFLNDYIGIGLLKNFFLITIAYFLLLGILFVYNFEYLALIFADMDFLPLIIGVLIFYGIILGIYSVVIYVKRRLRYEKAARHMRKYYAKLKEFYKYYNNNEIKSDEFK